MSADPEVLRRLAQESGRYLGELGVRPDDLRWIRAYAETIESLTRRTRARRFPLSLRRLARWAARKAR